MTAEPAITPSGSVSGGSASGGPAPLDWLDGSLSVTGRRWLAQPCDERTALAVAQSHADDANRLRGTGGTTGWLSIAAWTDWRPALLRATNDL